MVKGVDVSSFQGVINWGKAKADGVEFAILRSILKNGTLDSSFNRNYEGARAVGLPVGLYKYSYAMTVAQAQNEANAVIRALAGRAVECGVWLDLEDSSQRRLSKSQLTAIIEAFRDIVEGAGYKFGIYCNLDWYRNVIEVNKFDCPFWVARYPSSEPISLATKANDKYKPSINHTLWGWQYSSKGRVSGISGNVDVNECYLDLNSMESGTTNNTQDNAEEVYDMPVIKRGSTGKAVKLWQIIVGATPDGVYGKNTEAATKAFQKKKGLTVDGIVGKNSWKAGLESV